MKVSGPIDSVGCHTVRTLRCTQGHEWVVNSPYDHPRWPDIDIGGSWCHLCLEEKLVPLLEALGIGRVEDG